MTRHECYAPGPPALHGRRRPMGTAQPPPDVRTARVPCQLRPGHPASCPWRLPRCPPADLLLRPAAVFPDSSLHQPPLASEGAEARRRAMWRSQDVGAGPGLRSGTQCPARTHGLSRSGAYFLATAFFFAGALRAAGRFAGPLARFSARSSTACSRVSSSRAVDRGTVMLVMPSVM